MTAVVGLGAGGNAKVVIEILALRGGFEIVGLLDPRRELRGSEFAGIAVIGDDELLPGLARDGVRHAFIGVGSTGDLRPRSRLHDLVASQGLALIDAVHPASVVASSATIGGGATIMAGVVVNADARIGRNVVLNTGSVIEHDCVVGDHVHIATGARLGGGVVIGDGTHVGLGAAVNHGIRVGRGSIVGSGAVVVHDVDDGVVVVGCPARVLRSVEQ